MNLCCRGGQTQTAPTIVSVLFDLRELKCFSQPEGWSKAIDQAAKLPSRHAAVLLQLVHTRSPMWLDVNFLLHIRQQRSLRIGSWSGSGFLLLLLDDIKSLPCVESSSQTYDFDEISYHAAQRIPLVAAPQFHQRHTG